MGNEDRFRGQDLDSEYEPSMRGYDESSMEQEQGGRAPAPDSDSDLTYDLGGVVRSSPSDDEDEPHARQEDEFGSHDGDNGGR